MEGAKFGVAFLNDECAERQTKGDVVEGVGFGVLIRGDDGRGNGELDGGRHCWLSSSVGALRMTCIGTDIIAVGLMGL